MTESKPELDALLKVGTDGPAISASRKRQQHPAGWEPIQIGERGGFITTPPQAEPPADWNAFLNELLPPGMDASQFEVDGNSVEMRAWDGNVGGGELKRFYYFKARVRRKSALVGYDLDDIISAAKKAKIPSLKASEGTDRVYWMHITDLQAGQGDGDSVEGLVRRALELPQLLKADLITLAKSGKPVSKIFVPVTGDLVEGISGWYEMQQFAAKLDRRDQVKLVRRLLTEILLEMAKTGLPVHVAVVAGNHGEFRNNGKAFTSLSDNDDVAVVEQIAEAFELAGIENVTFSLPEQDRLSLTVEVAGWIVGLTHGHVAKYGNGPEGKILNWFKSMAATRDPIGDSDLLFTGHYHHPRFQSLIGDTYWIQGGALCDTSAWFSQSAGLVSDPCVLRGTITREQRAESVMPHFWPRTKPNAAVLGDK